MHAPASVDASHEKPKDFITSATMRIFINTSKTTHPSTSPKFHTMKACSLVYNARARTGGSSIQLKRTTMRAVVRTNCKVCVFAEDVHFPFDVYRPKLCKTIREASIYKQHKEKKTRFPSFSYFFHSPG